jgi:hypothetical protein
MFCLRNISVDTLHKGDTEDDDDNTTTTTTTTTTTNNNNGTVKWRHFHVAGGYKF